MQPVEILKDLYFIERGFLNANHFVYRSENPILIDTAYIADFDETAGAGGKIIRCATDRQHPLSLRPHRGQ
jgi:hypothetical protein